MLSSLQPLGVTGGCIVSTQLSSVLLSLVCILSMACLLRASALHNSWAVVVSTQLPSGFRRLFFFFVECICLPLVLTRNPYVSRADMDCFFCVYVCNGSNQLSLPQRGFLPGLRGFPG